MNTTATLHVHMRPGLSFDPLIIVFTNDECCLIPLYHLLFVWHHNATIVSAPEYLLDILERLEPGVGYAVTLDRCLKSLSGEASVGGRMKVCLHIFHHFLLGDGVLREEVAMMLRPASPVNNKSNAAVASFQRTIDRTPPLRDGNLVIALTK